MKHYTLFKHKSTNILEDSLTIRTYVSIRVPFLVFAYIWDSNWSWEKGTNFFFFTNVLTYEQMYVCVYVYMDTGIFFC